MDATSRRLLPVKFHELKIVSSSVANLVTQKSAKQNASCGHFALFFFTVLLLLLY